MMRKFFERGQVQKFSVEIFDASKPESEWPTGVERLKDWCGEPVYAHNWGGRVQQIEDGDGIEVIGKQHRIHARRDLADYRKV